MKKGRFLFLIFLFGISLASASSTQVLQGQHYIGEHFVSGNAVFNFTVYDSQTGGNVCFTSQETLTRGILGQWYTEKQISQDCTNSSIDYFLEIRIDNALQDINPQGDTRRRLTMYDYLRRDTGDKMQGNLNVIGDGNFTGTLFASDLNLTSPASINFLDVTDFIAKMFAQKITLANITRTLLSTDAHSFGVNTNYSGTTFIVNINNNDGENSSSVTNSANYLGRGISMVKFNDNHHDPDVAYLGNNFGTLRVSNVNRDSSNLTLGFNDGTIRTGIGDITGVANVTDVMVMNNKFAPTPFLTNFNYPVVFKNDTIVDLNLNVTGNVYAGSFIATNQSSYYFGEDIDNFTAKMSAVSQSVAGLTRNVVVLDADFGILNNPDGTLIMGGRNYNNSNKSGFAISSLNDVEDSIDMFKPSSNFPQPASYLLGEGDDLVVMNLNENIRLGFYTGQQRDAIGSTELFTGRFDVIKISNESIVNITGNIIVDGNLTGNNVVGYWRNDSGTIRTVSDAEVFIDGNMSANDVNVRSGSSITIGDLPDFLVKLSAVEFSFLNRTRKIFQIDKSTQLADNRDGLVAFFSQNNNDSNMSSTVVSSLNSLNNGLSLLKLSPNWTGLPELGLVTNEGGNLLIANVFKEAQNKIILGFHSDIPANPTLDITDIPNIVEVITIDDNSTTTPYLTNFTIGNVSMEQNLDLDGNLNLDNSNITNILSTVYNITGCNGTDAGTFCYDVDYDTMKFVTDSGQVLQMNQETTMPGKNLNGSIVDGAVVYVEGAIGNNPTFKLARADNLSTSGLLGVLTKDCNSNQVCPIVYFGLINSMDTSNYTAGDHLYLSATEKGNFTTTPPLFPNNPIWVATVIRVHQTEGSIFVFPRHDSANGITMNNLGLVGDFIQTDYKIRSLTGNDAIDQNVFTIEMNGTSGIDIPHLVLQPGGSGQASTWVRSGIVVPESVTCLNSTNRTEPLCFADEGNFTWELDFNTSLSEGADWGITGDLQVINTIFSDIIGSITNRITKIWASALDVSGDINQTNGSAIINKVYGDLSRGGNATISPDILVVTTGTQDSGNIDSVVEIDGDTLDVSEVTGTPGFDIKFNFTNFSATPRRVEYLGRYDGTPGHEVEIRIFNYTSGTYVDINSETSDISPNDQNQFLSFMIEGNTSEYLNGGVVSIQIIHTSSGNPIDDIFIDLISLTPSSVDLPNVGEFVQIADYDTSSNNSVTIGNNGNMTIQIPGNYRIEATSSFAGEGDSFLECSIFKNNNEEIELRFLRKLNIAGDIADATLSGVLENLTMGDDLDLRCASQIDDAFVTFANLDFYIERIGE